MGLLGEGEYLFLTLIIFHNNLLSICIFDVKKMFKKSSNSPSIRFFTSQFFSKSYYCLYRTGILLLSVVKPESDFLLDPV